MVMVKREVLGRSREYGKGSWWRIVDEFFLVSSGRKS